MTRSASPDLHAYSGVDDELMLRPAAGDIEPTRRLLERIDALVETTDRGLALADPSGGQTPIPATVLAGLRRIAEAIAHGRAVTVAPYDLELTTQQAAEMLHVSRPHLIKLLDRGDMPYHRTSDDPAAHRRVLLKDVEAYRHERGERRRETLRELSQTSQQAAGGYR